MAVLEPRQNTTYWSTSRSLLAVNEKLVVDISKKRSPKQKGTVHRVQGRHGEFEPGKVQYSTPKYFDWLFLITLPRNELLCQLFGGHR